MNPVTTDPGRAGPSLAVWSISAVLAAFLALQLAALAANGWVFEYPLDDVYIHLAMAEEIARGGYGVNSGQYASAASSPLYPFLLAFFPGTEFQRLLPLAWNAAALVPVGWLWGRTLTLAGFARSDRPAWIGITLATLGPLAANAYGVAFSGMEHTLHLAASLAIVHGLFRLVTEGRIGATLLIGTLLAPMMRLEGLALALAAAGAVAMFGRWRAGIGLGLLAVLPVAGFVVFLLSLGLAPIPNSAIAKLAVGGVEGSHAILLVAATLYVNLRLYMGLVVLGLVLLAFLAMKAFSDQDPRRKYFAFALGLAGLAHLCFGRIGWMNRYEAYLVATLLLGLLALIGSAELLRGRLRIATTAACMALAALSLGYNARYAVRTAYSGPAGIDGQQHQMARFAKEYWRRPVAVNDLGWVAWNNPDFVLDLWGLASDEARNRRLAENDPSWMTDLVARHDVRLVMIYDLWLGSHVGADWVRLGVLEYLPDRAVLGAWEVAFYAPDAVDVPELARLLREFAPTLPATARFEFAAGLPAD